MPAAKAEIVDQSAIQRVVETFYGRARQDPLLGPVFTDHVADWDAHLLRIRAFWSSVMLTDGSYSGSPMQRHAPLPIDAMHFDRWLALFEETVRQCCVPLVAQRFTDAAHRMSRSLQMGRAYGNAAARPSTLPARSSPQ